MKVTILIDLKERRKRLREVPVDEEDDDAFKCDWGSSACKARIHMTGEYLLDEKDIYIYESEIGIIERRDMKASESRACEKTANAVLPHRR